MAVVRLRPLSPLVVEPFRACSSLGRVVLSESTIVRRPFLSSLDPACTRRLNLNQSQRAYGSVERVVRLVKPSLLAHVNADRLWEYVEKEPALLMGRTQQNDTLLHLFLMNPPDVRRSADPYQLPFILFIIIYIFSGGKDGRRSNQKVGRHGGGALWRCSCAEAHARA